MTGYLLSVGGDDHHVCILECPRLVTAHLSDLLLEARLGVDHVQLDDVPLKMAIRTNISYLFSSTYSTCSGKRDASFLKYFDNSGLGAFEGSNTATIPSCFSQKFHSSLLLCRLFLKKHKISEQKPIF